jgi:hypothetical protein
MSWETRVGESGDKYYLPRIMKLCCQGEGLVLQHAQIDTSPHQDSHVAHSTLHDQDPHLCATFPPKRGSQASYLIHAEQSSCTGELGLAVRSEVVKWGNGNTRGDVGGFCDGFTYWENTLYGFRSLPAAEMLEVLVMVLLTGKAHYMTVHHSRLHRCWRFL